MTAPREKNGDRARAGFEALADGGVDAMLPFVHPEFEMETRPEIAAEPQRYKGHDGLRRYFESWYDAMDEVVIEPAAIEALDDERVFIRFEVKARGHASGLEVGMGARAVALIRDDLMYRLEFLLPGEPDPEPPG
jgi:ketosteroid isomerase-like protein